MRPYLKCVSHRIAIEYPPKPTPLDHPFNHKDYQKNIVVNYIKLADRVEKVEKSVNTIDPIVLDTHNRVTLSAENLEKIERQRVFDPKVS